MKNRFSRWRPWRPSWISDRQDFSYFNLQVTPMLPTKYRVNWPRGVEGVGLQSLDVKCRPVFIFFFFFFYFFFFVCVGFTALLRIFHLYRADLSSKVAKNQRTQGKTT